MNMIWIVHWSRSLSCSWWSLEWRSHSRRCCQSSEDHLQLCPSSWDESASWSGSTWFQRRRQRGERRGRWSNSAWQTPVWQLGPGAVAPSQQSLLSSSILFHWIKLFKLVSYSNNLGYLLVVWRVTYLPSMGSEHSIVDWTFAFPGPVKVPQTVFVV